MKRRTLLLGGLAGAAGAGWLLRPSDQGGNHSEYFQALSQALDIHGRARPTLVVDRELLRANIATLKSHIKNRFAYRIVVKSLPSLPLVQEVMEHSGTDRLMLFHEPFLSQVAQTIPGADVLMGKPQPVVAARNFYGNFSGGDFDSTRQLRWLLDTPERLDEYEALASELNQPMLAVIELDVGLHRGGVQTDEQLLYMLGRMRDSQYLKFAGFMGYEPHIVKMPFGDPMTYRDQAVQAYQYYIDVAKQFLGDQWPADAVLNAAGSPTYQMYDEGDFPFNELAVGSGLVKPTDFDLATLADHQPASYIATPVLKSLDTLQVPGLDLGPMISSWDPNKERTVYTYGGYWKAKPHSPPGLHHSFISRPTNQDMFHGSSEVNLTPDDWVFLRPTQSEFVFLQFGDIAVLENGQITENWPVFLEDPA